MPLSLLPVAWLDSTSDVLWTTSRFHIMASMGQNQRRRYISSSSPGGGTGAKLLFTNALLKGWNYNSCCAVRNRSLADNALVPVTSTIDY